MAKRAQPHTVAARVNQRELARIDAAARLTGRSRSEYVRDVLLPQAERDLRAEFADAAEGR